MGGSFRSGVQPPTGSGFLFSGLCSPAFAWVDRSGRGFNPRPAQDFCFLDSVPLLSCGWIVPVGGSTPDRLRIFVFRALFLCFRVGGSFRSGVQPPTGSGFLFSGLCSPAFAWVDRSGRGFNPRPAQDFCFPGSVPLLSRGWIVPVGGSTPDRLKDRRKNRHRPAQEGRGRVILCGGGGWR